MTSMTETHGGYEIESGPLPGAWAARAVRHETVVAKAVGPIREAAVAHLKRELN